MADRLVSQAGRESTVYRDRQLVVERTQTPPGLRFFGEIDISNSVAIGHALAHVLDGQPMIHLDFRSLVFADVSGIRAVVTVARAMGSNRHLLLHGLASELEYVFDLVGWADEQGLSFCDCAKVEA